MEEPVRGAEIDSSVGSLAAADLYKANDGGLDHAGHAALYKASIGGLIHAGQDSDGGLAYAGQAVLYNANDEIVHAGQAVLDQPSGCDLAYADKVALYQASVHAGQAIQEQASDGLVPTYQASDGGLDHAWQSSDGGLAVADLYQDSDGGLAHAGQAALYKDSDCLVHAGQAVIYQASEGDKAIGVQASDVAAIATALLAESQDAALDIVVNDVKINLIPPPERLKKPPDKFLLDIYCCMPYNRSSAE